MACIPDKDIERLKSEVSLQRLVESHGITLKKHGQDVIGLCPFHDDKEPSLVITPKKNLWHCLGACQTGGSVIDWVMQMEGVSFRHAVELIQNDLPSLAAKPKRVIRSQARKLDAPFTIDTDDQQLLNEVMDYYHQTLKQSPEARAYLAKRGIENDELIDRFKLGFANRTLGYRLPRKDNNKTGAVLRQQLTTLGILRDTGHEHFNGSLVIPVFDEAGNVVEVYGRKITRRLRQGTPLHLYLPGPHKGIWNFEGIKNSEEIILCESLIDALTFWHAGYKNVTTSYGIEGFTQEHLATFKQYHVERILIAYDRDDAGEAATEKLSKQLIAAGLDCYRCLFPKGMDANEYAVQGCTSVASAGSARATALSVQPANKSLGVVIQSAVWLGKGDAPTITTSTNKDKKEEKKLSPLVAEQTESALPAERIPAQPTDRSCASLHPRHTVHPVHNINAIINDDEIIIVLGDRRYRIRGLDKNMSYDLLKVNVLVSKEDALHVDTFDLYSARHRRSFIKQAAVELGLKDDIIKTDLGKVLIKLELLQQEQIEQALLPDESVLLNESEREAALALLHSPDLLNRILCDFSQCGVVGEETNKLVGYLAAVSRKLDNPLAIIIQSTSAAGKSSLMDAVLAMIPEEERVHYSAMTGQSLFYMGETNLKHKILAIAEEEGASNASYALKLLQSEGELTIASTGKDENSGELVTKEYRVEGPVMLCLTTTAIDIDEELLNRCLVLTVDENREQTQAIHQLQRKRRTLEGLLLKQEKQTLLTLHCNAQRLLKPLAVVNPYAEQLTFLDDRTRTRRDHEKYLTLIESIALLHQYQREIKTVEHNNETIEYIEVTLEDIDKANHLVHEILGRTLDELPPQTRRLLTLIHTMVSEQCKHQSIEQSHYRFSRRQVREYSGWGNTQLQVHLQRLEALEYLLVHRGGRGQSYVYELLYDGQGETGQAFLQGLINIEKLAYDAKKPGAEANLPGSNRPQNGGKPGDKRTKQTAEKPQPQSDSEESDKKPIRSNYTGEYIESSYHSPVLVAKSN